MREHYQKALAQTVMGALYVVATPVGNLSDMGLRALAVLSRADLICAEDTRITRRLLAAYGLSGKNIIGVREQNECGMSSRVIEALSEGLCVAQVSDAGTPAICDPGARLVREVRAAGFPIIPICGASALTAALSVAEVTASDFYFAGFLPSKSSERDARLASWRDVPYAVAFFEVPHRIEETLTTIASLYPKRRLVWARELTKLHENILVGMAEELLPEACSRGESVLVLHPEAQQPVSDGLSEEGRRLIEVLASELPARQAASLAAQLCDDGKKVLYAAAVAVKNRE